MNNRVFIGCETWKPPRSWFRNLGLHRRFWVSQSSMEMTFNICGSRNSTLQHVHEERDPDLWRDITHPLQLRRVIRHILQERVCLMRASHTQPKKTAGHGLPSRSLPSFYPWLLSPLSSPKHVWTARDL